MVITLRLLFALIFLITLLEITKSDEVTSSEYALFENILRQTVGNEKVDKIVSIEKKSVTKRKSNFSHLLRFIVVYTTTNDNENTGTVNKTMRFIVKNEPKPDEMVDASETESIHRMNLFDIEATVMRDIVPWLEEVVGRSIGPKFYYYSQSERILVMEDLGFLNFVNRKFERGMTDDDVTLVLELMAQFHAGSVLLHERNSTAVSKYNTGLVNKYLDEDFYTSCSSTLKSLGNYLKNSPNEKLKSISKKLINIADVIKTELQNLYKIDDGDLAVLNHGDCWNSNFMFNDDDNGKPKDIRFLDFQLSVWASPSIDLVYFFGVAGIITPTFNHDNYVQIYLNKLTETMKKIGCSAPPPTIEKLRQSMQKHRANMLFMSLVLAPTVRAREAGLDRHSFVENEENRWTQPDAKLIIDRLLPMMDDKGYLD